MTHDCQDTTCAITQTESHIYCVCLECGAAAMIAKERKIGARIVDMDKLRAAADDVLEAASYRTQFMWVAGVIIGWSAAAVLLLRAGMP